MASIGASGSTENRATELRRFPNWEEKGGSRLLTSDGKLGIREQLLRALVGLNTDHVLLDRRLIVGPVVGDHYEIAVLAHPHVAVTSIRRVRVEVQRRTPGFPLVFRIPEPNVSRGWLLMGTGPDKYSLACAF